LENSEKRKNSKRNMFRLYAANKRFIFLFLRVTFATQYYIQIIIDTGISDSIII